MTAEIVHAVLAFHDSPREGVADLLGRPHAFDCQFDHDLDDFTDRFHLTALSDNAFRMIMERHALFLRWREAFDGGKASLDTWPTLPDDRPRYDALAQEIEREKALGDHPSKIMRGCFTLRNPLVRRYDEDWQVEWSEPEIV